MSSSEQIREAISGVTDLRLNSFQLLKAAPNPKIGYVSIQTPEEIFLAAGLIPFRLGGERGGDITDAYARLSNNFCSYVMSCFSEGLSGVYDFVDGVVFADACDQRKRLYEAWKRDIAKPNAYFLELPNYGSEITRDYFAQCLRKLIGELEVRYGRRIGDDALKGAIALCNRSRELMQALYQYKKRGAQVLTGTESLQVVKAATTGLKETFNARMTTLLETLQGAEEPTARKRQRVLICGSYFDHQGIIDTIEEAGADIVCEDLSNGVKYFEGQVSLEGDPVTALADYYLGKNSSARRLETEVRVQHLLELAREYRAESVIYYSLKFCDTNLHDYPYVLEKLREAKLPVLFIEAECNGTNIASTKTRIETFLQSRLF